MSAEVETPQTEDRQIQPTRAFDAPALGNLGGGTEVVEPEQEEEKPQGFEFAGRTYKTREAAEAAFRSMQGTKDQTINDLKGRLEKNEAVIEALSKIRDKAEDKTPLTQTEKQEVKRFAASLTKDQIQQFNDIFEEKGPAYAYTWMLTQFESLKDERVDKLEKALADLKRSAIEEPAEVQKESQEWADDLTNIAQRASQIAVEGEGTIAEAFAEVFPPDADPKQHAKNLDEVHQILLANHMDATPESFYEASLAWIGYNYLLSKNGGQEKGRRRETESKEQRTDPSITATRVGSGPRNRGEQPSFLGRSTPSGPLGKL